MAHGYVPHSNAGSERDFSVLARLLTPLGKSILSPEIVENRKLLMLNVGSLQ